MRSPGFVRSEIAPQISTDPPPHDVVQDPRGPPAWPIFARPQYSLFNENLQAISERTSPPTSLPLLAAFSLRLVFLRTHTNPVSSCRGLLKEPRPRSPLTAQTKSETSMNSRCARVLNSASRSRKPAPDLPVCVLMTSNFGLYGKGDAA